MVLLRNVQYLSIRPDLLEKLQWGIEMILPHIHRGMGVWIGLLLLSDSH